MARTVPAIIRWGAKGLLVGIVLLAACRDPAKVSGTALYVTTEFDPTLLLTQVRIWGEVAGQPHFGPRVVPEHQERVLHSGETLRVLLGDVPNGVPIQVTIEGLRDSGVVARGEARAEVRDGYEVDVKLRLERTETPPGDGGTGGDGTFCMGCEGCCIQGQCAGSTFNTCGTGGIACVACDPARATGCDKRGVCVCGVNPACSPNTADRCVLGMCRCGNAAACGSGQLCIDGECRCTADSCPGGCCAGNLCEPGNTKDRCGRGGAACAKCRNTCRADGSCA